MNPLELRQLGETGLQVTRLGFGTGPLGGARVRLSDHEATATVVAAVRAGINYYDTAPWYGVGQAELHLGRGLVNQARSRLVISTKIGRVLSPATDPLNPPYAARWPGGAANDLRFDYTRDGVSRSLAASLDRLALDRVDSLVIHDLDSRFHDGATGVAARFAELERGGGFDALSQLKASGTVRALGAGINHAGMIPLFLERFALDFFLVAMPYTLMDQSALDTEFPLCAERGVSIVVGAPFCSGLLAPGAHPDAWYGYRAASPVEVEKVRGIETICGRHGVSLGAAALQFPFGHPSVAAVIPGPESPQHVHSNLALMRETIPADFWLELKSNRLLRADAPTP